MNVTPTLVSMMDNVTMGLIHTHASVPVDILATTVKRVSIYLKKEIQLFYHEIEHYDCR